MYGFLENDALRPLLHSWWTMRVRVTFFITRSLIGEIEKDSRKL